jgi:hypothetical protein
LGPDLSSPVSVEQLSPYPTSILLTTRFGSPGTPSTYTDTFKQGQAKRKRPAPSATIRSEPAHEADALSTVPRYVRDKWDEIAGQENTYPTSTLSSYAAVDVGPRAGGHR